MLNWPELTLHVNANETTHMRIIKKKQYRKGVIFYLFGKTQWQITSKNNILATM